MNTTSCFSFQSEMAQQTCNAYAKEKKKQMIYIYRHSHGACTSYSCSFIQHAYIPENSLYHMKTQGQYNGHVSFVISINFTRRWQSFTYRKNIDTGLPPTALTEHLIKQKATNLHSFLCTYRQNLNAESETHMQDRFLLRVWEFILILEMSSWQKCTPFSSKS